MFQVGLWKIVIRGFIIRLIQINVMSILRKYV